MPPVSPSTTIDDEPTIIAPPSVAQPIVTVQGVIDSRTVVLSDGAQVRVKGLAEPGACWAAAATTFAKAMLLDKPVSATLDADGAGTLVLPDGADYGLLAIELGHARADVTADSAAQDAQTSAERARIGLWGPPCGTPPPVSTQPPSPQTSGCTVTYRVTHEWPSGFRTDVTVRNTGNTAVDGWTLRWTFPDDQSVTQMWNAKSAQSGKQIAAKNESYNSVIAAGASVLLGFTGAHQSGNKAPSDFTLNGHRCRLA